MKILVIFTGGTIGSSVSSGWISPSDDMKYLLINKFREKSDIEVEFETVTPYTILSENLSAENLNMLIKTVRENVCKYDGIIVTHGTDTLQYSAAALAFATGFDTNPVVLVSSNYPLEDDRANGLDNFIAAVEFIKSKLGRGVFVSYKNNGEKAKIHIATRILSHNECLDEIHSIDNHPFAFYDGKITINPEFRFAFSSESVPDAVFCENSSVLVVNAMPGDDFRYDPAGYKAVILRPYHSGTLNTLSTSFAEFCKRAKNMDIPVFIVNVHGGTTYESSKLFDNLGITVLPMCSFPAIYMKLWLSVSKNEKPEDFVLRYVNYEFLPN